MRRGSCWRWREVRRLCLCPDVLQNLANAGAAWDERDGAHLTTAERAQQREDFADAGDQRRPQAVRRAFWAARAARAAAWQ